MALALVPAVLIVGLVALRWSGALPATRRALFGYYGAIAVLAGLTSAGGIAVTVTRSPNANPPAFGVVYACYLLLLGSCLLLAGVEVARRGEWVGWQRWLLVALGAWLVAPVLPALAAGSPAGGWAVAGWFALFAVLGAALIHEGRRVGHEQLDQRPRAVTSARAAAVLTWVSVAAFGSPAIPVAAHLLQNQTLPAFFDLFSMYGGPLWDRLSVGAFVGVLVAFFVVNLLAAWAAWLLWNGSRTGAILTLVLLPVEAAFWAGYALPGPPLIGVMRLALIALAWTSLSLRPGRESSGPPAAKTRRPGHRSPPRSPVAMAEACEG